MTRVDPDELAAGWVQAWNRHDLDAVLSHFTEDACFASPLVPVVTGRDNPVRGHEEMRAYWEEGLRRLPALQFSLERVYSGSGCVAIAYRNERGRPALEVLVLDEDGKAARGWALYGPEPPGEA